MKIALALPSFDPHGGDLEASTFELARRLLALKNDVHVVAQHFSDAGLELPIVAHRIGGTRSPLRRAAAAEAKLHSLHADVIHDMGLTWYADVFTSPVGSPTRMWQSELAGTAWWARPLRRIISRLNPRTGQRAELARRQLDESDSVCVAQSETVADDYRALHGVPEDRIRVIPFGVDIKKFSPHIRKLRRETTRRKLGVAPKGVLLLSLAGSHQQGTWKLTFRALRRLVAKQVPVSLVVAATSGAAFPEKLADRFGVAQHVKVVGQVADRIPFYAAADAILAPALYAPFDLAVLEAAACGLPCITTRESGISDLLKDGTDSHVLKRHSPKDLAERIESFTDPALWERMSRGARRTAMKYTLDRNVDKLVQIYEEVVEARGQRKEGILTLPPTDGQNSTTRRAA